MPISLTEKQKELVLGGLNLFKKSLKKMLKQSEELKVGEKPVKETFLEVESIINQLNQN